MKNIFDINGRIFDECKEHRDDNERIPMLLTGEYGIGKTNAALLYCIRNPGSLYFSFKNIDSSLAPSIFAKRYSNIFSECYDWKDFFLQLEKYAKNIVPAVFFDDYGDRNDKEEFLNCLNDFLNRNKYICQIILIINKGERMSHLGEALGVVMQEFNPVIVRKAFDRISEADAFRLSALTDGYYELLKLYNDEISFEENIKQFLNNESPFYRFAVDYLSHFLRSPESYNTLLYAIALGNNRITEMSDFTGFPKNKVDKYIKALQEIRIVRKTKDRNGHSIYVIKNNYFKLWYKYLFAEQTDIDGNFSNIIIADFINELEHKLVPETFSKWCCHWIYIHQNRLSDRIPHVYEEKNLNVNINGIVFDYAETVSGKLILLKTFTNKPSKEKWLEIEKAALTVTPFYNTEFIIGSMNGFKEYYWNINRKYDNVHLVQVQSLNI